MSQSEGMNLNSSRKNKKLIAKKLIPTVEGVQAEQHSSIGAAFIQKFEGSGIYIIKGEIEDSGVMIINGEVELDE